ncbi:MAG TPA: phosphotransferase [Sphingobium sp.]|nr:phosphotransferase [Sphingobium sp.]
MTQTSEGMDGMTGNQDIGALPIEQEAITKELLEKALCGSFPGVKLDSFRIEDVHHGFSTVLRVHLTPAADSSASGLPASVILKGGFESHTRNRGKDFTYLSLEMEFHAFEMLPELGLNMPKVFSKYLDRENAQMVILMEDLTLAKVRFQRGLSPNNAQQVARRLTALADLHSRTWGSPELKEGGKYGGLPKNGATMFLDYLDHANYDQGEWDNYMSRPRGQACPVRFQDYDWLKRYVKYTADMSDGLPNCVIHGDTHLGNLYEEADGTPGFFDSLARQEPGISEATYHICNALDPIERRKHERDLVAHYRSELIARGIKVPSQWEMMHQYAAFLSLNYLTFAVNENHYQTEAFNTAHAVRAAMAIMDNNAYDLV